jgi:hypothetical protein
VDPAGPVLDLAPGDGALLARAATAGIPARAVPPGDPLAALAAEAPGSLGGVVALGLGDRLAPEGWRALADLVATRLRPGGGLVLEIINPLTLAGRALRLRDPGLAPPVHPETLAFLLRAAGLAEVEERPLGAFTGPEALPLDPDPLDVGDERMNEVVHFVNGRVVGRPLVAILARLPTP